ncbi:hypothetical protein N3K66_008124 [Trichothecium roseum]|uniref:Uncharacterized protein n=1 Tax=Trichothecium roseum TaxID=47278 RepID=A0ACC0UUB1_9HYPO|nr:hypothetical protein N3K66_008124 [Trichothecium roseum]
MKFLAMFASVCAASAIRISELPECATRCYHKKLEAFKCGGPDDIECLCREAEFKDDIYPCVRDNCGIKDM